MKELNKNIHNLLQQGTVIPAHPLALNQHLLLDEQRQRSLTRYYMASGAGGVAVGVHTTQFEIRKPEINLLEPVLKIAADEIDKAFDKFHRFKSSKTGGTGLGLSIVKGFVEAQNGTISLKNNDEGGATFELVFNVDCLSINSLKNE